MSNYREMAPSMLPEDSTPSSPGKFAEDGPTTSGDAGGLRGDGHAGTSTDAGEGSGNGGDSSKNRKRRPAGSVSVMACNPCRQARQKCDGQRPDLCSRCAQRKLDCVYKPHTKSHKNDLIREIGALRGENTLLQERNKEFEELAAENDIMNHSLREEGKSHKIILETIGRNGHDREIIRGLRAGESHQAIADWLVRENPDLETLDPQTTTHRKLVGVVKLFEAQYQEQDSLHRPNSSDYKLQWTNVTTNTNFIGHLFDLYFTWVHPIHMLFSELEFKEDFKFNQENHCSASLVNAICAMACNLLETEHGLDRQNPLDAATLRDNFMREARKFLLPESYRVLTSVQTFAVLFLVELSSGKARNAIGYLRSAIDNIKFQDSVQHSEEAKELTLWGIQTLNSVSAGTMYLKFYTPSVPAEPFFQHAQMDKDDAVWRFYRRPGDEREMATRPSYAILTACHQARLFRVVNETLNLYCGTRGQVSAYKFLDMYRRYLDWKESLPPIITNVDEGHHPLPHIIYLHVQYHTALVQLFRPLVHGNFFADSAQDELRRILIFHARSGVEQLGHAQRLYSTRYSLPLMNFCLVQLCDALLSYSPLEPPASETVAFCLHALQHTHAGFALCGPLQSLFTQRVRECGIRIPEELEKLVDSVDDYSVHDILDACTRLSYTEPLDQIIRYIDPLIAKEWNGEWEIQIIGRKRSRDRLQIDHILNE